MDCELLTREELAERLKLSVRGVDEYTKQGILPVIKPTKRTVRYEWTAVVAALRQFETKSNVSALDQN